MHQDIEPQEMSHAALAEEVRVLRLINETGARVASELNLERNVQAVVDVGVSLTGAEFGAFFYNGVSDEGEAFLLYALSGADPAAFSAFPHPRPTPVFAPTFNGEGVIRSDDITRDPRYGQMEPHRGMPAGHLPVRSYLAVPVVSRSGQALGGLFFGHPEAAQFSARHERIMVAVAAQAATAIDNARTYEAARLEIRKREVAELALQDTDRRLQAVLNNATVSIFLMDDRQQCVYMNAAAEALTGYRFEETRGRTLHDVIHHTRPDGSPFPLHECAIDRAFPENNQQQGEEVFVHRDGSFYPVAFTASPMRDEAGVTVGTIIEVRDISEERRHAATRELLMREVDHRARNALTVVQSLVQLAGAPDVGTYKTVLLGRVGALARAQGSLADRKWEGARVRDLIRDELASLWPEEASDIRGPDVAVSPDQAQPVSMLIHELATNASKHGALSVVGGRVRVEWSMQGRDLVLVWSESGGPALTAPERTGFGSRLVEQLARQLRAEVSREWRPDGLQVRLVMPLAPAAPGAEA
ncbi:PAS domain-containing protein [uncultured Brevundimonas sp.]|uniref:PAS domain-containing protein n=1 Tax=uncultured Brevundimonas sp. TaxID=213418 RepID=UPI0030EE761E|tara:strand:- start:1559 stop:3145 length:1587 start_codon:yes stop_codon:yes gene_type:complete